MSTDVETPLYVSSTMVVSGVKSMKVPWDSIVFGRDSSIQLYLYRQDVMELMSGKEELNIIVIQLWMI